MANENVLQQTIGSNRTGELARSLVDQFVNEGHDYESDKKAYAKDKDQSLPAQGLAKEFYKTGEQLDRPIGARNRVQVLSPIVEFTHVSQNNSCHTDRIAFLDENLGVVVIT
jgi:hypothetical protein